MRLARRLGTLLATLLGVAVVLWYGFWRYQLLSGRMQHFGGPCAGRFDCDDGLCLVHAATANGDLRTVAGYCSRGCKEDRDCGAAAGMRCVERPSGLSRAAGDTLPYVVVPARLCLRRAE